MRKIIIFFSLFIFLNCHSYEWMEIGDFDEPIWKYFEGENNSFQVVGVDEGLYLNTNDNWEYYPRVLRVFDIADLGSTHLLVTDGDATCMGAGLWDFDIETHIYDIVMWAWFNYKILHCNDNYYFIAGDYWQSSNGFDWNYYNYWGDEFIYSIAAYENHVVVATENNIFISEDEGITFIPAEPDSINIADLVFNCNGILYGRTPYFFEDSIIYVSYDFGVTWNELLYGSYIGEIGVDSSGRLFVGWRGYPEDYSGIAYWDEQTESLIYLNDNLPNMEINRIQPYEINGNSSVICCTQEGLYYLTDYVSSNNSECIEDKIQLSNYPNPFNPTTIIEFSIHNDSQIELSIYNIKGQKIKTLIQDEFTTGSHSITWNGEDESGNSVSSGIYYYKLDVNGKTKISKKCLLLK